MESRRAFDRNLPATLLWCLSERESIIIKDVAASERLQYPEEALSEGIRAIVSVPILFYGDTIGTLRLYHHEPWEVSEKDLDSLQLLAENIGLAMVYTRLLNAARMVREAMDDFPWERVP
jgi:GAF domain-containing protein